MHDLVFCLEETENLEPISFVPAEDCQGGIHLLVLTRSEITWNGSLVQQEVVPGHAHFQQEILGGQVWVIMFD